MHKIRSSELNKILKGHPRVKRTQSISNSRLLVLVGSYENIGSAILSAKAAYRSGARNVTIHTPMNGLVTVQTALPEAQVSIDSNYTITTTIPDLSKFDAVVCGNSMGTHMLTIHILQQLIKTNKPTIFDGNAVGFIKTNPEIFGLMSKNHILSFDQLEFTSIFGGSEFENDEDVTDLQMMTSHEKTNIILKKERSVFTNFKNEKFESLTGNSALLTSGSGDVLAGIVGGMLAQGLQIDEAVKVAVYVHGLSAEIATEYYGERSVMAHDIVDFIGGAFEDF